MKKYYPEGARADIEAVEKRLSSPAELKNAFLSGESLEARAVLCDRGHNLDVDLCRARNALWGLKITRFAT